MAHIERATSRKFRTGPAALDCSPGAKRASIFAEVGILEIGPQREGFEVNNRHLLPIHLDKLVLTQAAKGAIDVDCGEAQRVGNELSPERCPAASSRWWRWGAP